MLPRRFSRVAAPDGINVITVLFEKTGGSGISAFPGA